MYEATVTVFNKYQSKTAFMWYPHVLTGVNLVADKGQMLKQYGPDSKDNAELHVAYTEMDGKKIIIDGMTGHPILNTMGEPLPWLKPEDWKKQVNDLLDDTITFNTGDFFWIGEWNDGAVNDDDYFRGKYEGFYAYMNREHDFVYLVSGISLPYTLIPYFPILGE